MDEIIEGVEVESFDYQNKTYNLWSFINEASDKRNLDNTKLMLSESGYWLGLLVNNEEICRWNVDYIMHIQWKQPQVSEDLPI